MSQQRSPDIEGDFHRYPFPRLLFFLAKKAFLGEMVITRSDESTAHIFFRDGLPVYTDLRANEDILGRVLLERGWITDTVFNESMVELAKGGKLQGQILLDMGVLSQARLVEGLILQLRRKLNRLFYDRETTFVIFNGDHPHGCDGEAQYVRIDPLALIYQGIRNAYDRDRLEPELTKLTGSIVHLTANPTDMRERYKLNNDEAALAELIARSPLPFSRILEISPLGTIQTLMMIYALWVTEALIIVGEDTARAPTIAAPAPTSPARPAIAPPPPAPATAPPPSATTPKPSATTPTPPTTPTAAVTPRIKAPARHQVSVRTDPVDPAQAEKHSKLILAAYANLEKQDHFEVLGVAKDCQTEAVRTAYFKLAKDYHPDRTAALGTENVRKEAEMLFRRINEAHAVLADPTRRQAYEEQLAHSDEDDQEVRDALDAEIAFQQGTVFFRKKNYTEALMHFEKALKLSPKEGEHVAWVAWTVFSNPNSDRKAVLPLIKEDLLASINLSPKSAPCHYFLGEIYLAQGEEKRAQTCFKRVLEIQPYHVDAKRHIRLLNMRQEKGSPKSGFFGRIKK